MTPELIVYYGHDARLIPRLRQCQTLVFEARGWTPPELAALKAPGGPRLLAYLSVLAWPEWAGPPRWWWGPRIHDPTWNAWWYSWTHPGWRYQVRRLSLAPRQSCHGLFLDNLDRLQADPASAPYLRKWIASLRQEWPDGYLLGNRGTAHWSWLANSLDGVMLENLTDRSFSKVDRKWVEDQLSTAQRCGVDLYALDYADRREPKEVERLRGLFPEMVYSCALEESLQSLSPEPA